MGKTQQRKQWQAEFNDLVCGASGGFLFGVPLLYTMEIWQIGSTVSMPRLLLALMITYAIVFMLNRTAGFRKLGGTHPRDDAIDTVEAMAIGIICASLILILLREIRLDTPLNQGLGKVVYEGIPFTLGVALANQFIYREEDDQPQPQPHSNRTQHSEMMQVEAIQATVSDINGTLIGAIIIAFNIAPTDEIPTLAAAVTGLWLLGIMAVSLIVSYAIVFAAGFGDQSKRHQQRGLFQRPFSETIVSYLLSLLAALGMLVFFNKLNNQDPWQVWLSYTIILGLPATIGGAAGRLAV